MPPATAFNPVQLNATEWMESVRDYGGKYAVLTVQAGELLLLLPLPAVVTKLTLVIDHSFHRRHH
jgi:hypothetical protein